MSPGLHLYQMRKNKTKQNMLTQTMPLPKKRKKTTIKQSESLSTNRILYKEYHAAESEAFCDYKCFNLSGPKSHGKG